MSKAVKEMLKRFPRVKRSAARLMSLVPLSARLGRTFWAWPEKKIIRKSIRSTLKIGGA